MEAVGDDLSQVDLSARDIPVFRLLVESLWVMKNAAEHFVRIKFSLAHCGS